LREKKALGPFLEEVKGYLLLLRRHSFLRYVMDVREYKVKRMVVIDGIVEALEQVTRTKLPVFYDEVPVESLIEVTAVSVERLMRQTIRNMKRSLILQGSAVPATGSYHQAIVSWEKALHVFVLRPKVN
jgi:hypothetical protein